MSPEPGLSTLQWMTRTHYTLLIRIRIPSTFGKHLWYVAGDVRGIYLHMAHGPQSNRDGSDGIEMKSNLPGKT